MHVAYVLTGGTKSLSAFSLCLSVASLRLTNPEVRVSLICDAETHNLISSTSLGFLRNFDEVLSIATPKGSVIFQNRFLKIHLRKIIKGDVLYLDNDTLVRGSIKTIFAVDADLAIARNHSSDYLDGQIWVPEQRIIEELGWKISRSEYFNGGVIFMRDTYSTRMFAQCWLKRWCEGIRLVNWERDQASLNASLSESDVNIYCLPHAFNYQFRMAPRFVRDATIWHFYSAVNPQQPDTRFFQLVNNLLSCDNFVPSDVNSLIAAKHPWLRGGLLGSLFLVTLEFGLLPSFSLAVLRRQTSVWAIKSLKRLYLWG